MSNRYRSETILLESGNSVATIAAQGAELVAWQVGGVDLIWSGDPRWWARSSPILFPIVGWTRDKRIRIDGRAYPMDVHGFAAGCAFLPERIARNEARFVLAETEATQDLFPFAFRLAVNYRLEGSALSARFEVRNPGSRALPYALGLHPGFRWPLAGGDREGHAVVFEKPEPPHVPVIAPGGLFSAERRPIPLAGRYLPLSDELFAQEALCFLDAASRRLSFVDGIGHALDIEVEDFPHFALWTKPGAPFLSVEVWTGHGDPQGFEGEIFEKPSMRLLPPGGGGSHAVRFTWRDGGVAS